jgi:hypothetical protein
MYRDSHRKKPYCLYNVPGSFVVDKRTKKNTKLLVHKDGGTLAKQASALDYQ